MRQTTDSPIALSLAAHARTRVNNCYNSCANVAYRRVFNCPTVRRQLTVYDDYIKINGLVSSGSEIVSKGVLKLIVTIYYRELKCKIEYPMLTKSNQCKWRHLKT